MPQGRKSISAVPPELLWNRVSLELRQVLSLLRGARVPLLAWKRSRNQLRKQYPFARHRLAASDGSLKRLRKGLSSIIVFHSYEIKWILTQIKMRVNIADPRIHRTFIVFSVPASSYTDTQGFLTRISKDPADPDNHCFRLTNPNNSVSLY